MIYSTLFILAGCASLLIQFHLGVKRSIPALPLALALTGSVLLFMIFMKFPFLALGLAESEVASLRYMMTGGLGTVAAVLAARYILKIGFDRLDDAALVFPLTIALIKVGCFFTGCCFGIPGGGALSVTYNEISPALVFYTTAGNHLGHTPGLHPVQLYEAAGAFLILVGILFMRKRWRQPGSAFFFLFVAYLPLRFVMEFFRATDVPAVWNGLKSVQVVCLVLWIGAVFLWRRNEEKTFFKRQGIAMANPAILIAYFTVEVALFFLFADYLHFIEKIVVVTAFVLSALSMLQQIPRWPNRLLRRVSVLPVAIAVILIFTAQVSQDTVRYKSVQFGVSAGKYVNTYSDTDGCDALTNDFEQQYTMLGAGFSSYKRKGRSWTEFGVTAFGGKQKEAGLDVSSPGERQFNTFGVSGYGKLDHNWIGLGGGLSFGNLRYAEDRIVQPLGTVGYFKTPVMPSAHLRLGPRRWLFVQYDFANAFPTSSPGHMQELSVGSGIGLDNGFALRLGGQLGHIGTFLNLTVPAKYFELDANYTFGTRYAGTPAINMDTRQLRFSIKYHLRPKE